ncbi:MAG TPA: hypothetical protein V6D28_07765 [Leptolyngbyaceae cyanobacterium]
MRKLIIKNIQPSQVLGLVEAQDLAKNGSIGESLILFKEANKLDRNLQFSAKKDLYQPVAYYSLE